MAVEAALSNSSADPESVGENSSIDWLHEPIVSVTNEIML